MEKDLKVIQDVKIIQQLLARVPEGNQINIIQVYNTGSNGNGHFDFADYLESLLQPRLKTLVDRAVGIAKSKCRTDMEAGAWLGGSQRLINYRKEKLNKLIREEK